MININSKETGHVREFFGKSKKAINIVMSVCAILSILYFVFWALVEASDVTLKYAGNIMAPLAGFIFPNTADTIIYRDTSFFFMGLIIPTLIMHYVFDRLEEVFLSASLKEHNLKVNREIAYDNKRIISRYDTIDKYSICLSLEYEPTELLNEQMKLSLNKAIYTKLETALRKDNCNISTASDDTMIVISADFESYDIIYGKIILLLAKIKKAVEKNYSVKIVPSLTTDAFGGKLSPGVIRQRHREIKSLIRTNRACSTAVFTEKYKHTKHNKYTGVPVEYISSQKNGGGYELNIIYGNLTETLAGLV